MLQLMPAADCDNIAEMCGTNHSWASVPSTNYAKEEVIATVDKVHEPNETSAISER